MSIVLIALLLLSLTLFGIGIFLDARQARLLANTNTTQKSVNRYFLAARLGALAKVATGFFIALLIFSDILTALGFAIGVFCSGFLAWHFQQISFRENTEESTSALNPSGITAGMMPSVLAVLCVGGYLTLLGFMTPSGQTFEPIPLWGLALGISLSAWLIRVRPSGRWISRGISARFPAHCEGNLVHPLVWFELLSLALIVLIADHNDPAYVLPALFLIVSFTFVSFLLDRINGKNTMQSIDQIVVFTLLAGCAVFVSTGLLHLPETALNPWQNIFGPVIAGMTLIWFMLLTANNAAHFPGRLTLMSIALLFLYISYGRQLFGESGLGYLLLGVLSIAPVMFSLSARIRTGKVDSAHADAVAMRFTHLVAGIGAFILIALLSRTHYLELSATRDIFYDGMVPAAFLLLLGGIFSSRWLRRQDDELLLEWSQLDHQIPLNRHSREWPMVVNLGRRFTFVRLVPLFSVAALPPAAALAGYPAYGIAAVAGVALVLLPRVFSDTLRYAHKKARESQLFDLLRIALIALFLVDSL